MIIDRLAGLMKRLTCNTLLGDFVAPALEALAQTRRPNAGGTRVLGMDHFITFGVLRHLQAIPTTGATPPGTAASTIPRDMRC